MSEGDTLTYTITATNNGTATLTNVVVTDNKITPNTISCLTVAPGDTCVLSGTYTVTPADVTAGEIINDATANSDQTPESSAQNVSGINAPSLTLVKPAPDNADEDGNGEISEGDTLTYTITATNNGTATLTNVVVTDNKITPNTISCATLAPATTCVLSGTYTVTPADVTAGEIINDATANSDQTAESTAQNNSGINAPSLTLVKPAPSNADEDDNGEISEGDTLTYTITATNNGAATLTNVIVTDSLLATPNDTITCANVISGSTCVLTGNYVVTASDVSSGSIVNNASVISDQTPAVDASNTSSILEPSLVVVKPEPVNADEDSNGEISEGDTLTYTITATNNGAATLTNVVVTDSLLEAPNDTITCSSLATGETCVLTGNYTVTNADVLSGQILNTASAVSDQTITPVTDSVTSEALIPSASINKSEPVNSDEDGNGVVSAGDTLTYTVTYTNTGTATLSNISINDSQISPSSKTCLTLAPNDSCVLVGVKTVTEDEVNAGSITNTASGDSAQLAAISDSVTTKTANPEIRSVKSASEPELNADGTFSVKFTIITKNTGTIDLSSLTLIDDLNAQLGTSLVEVTTPPIVSFADNASGNSQLPTVNSSYSGLSGSTNLLTGANGLLVAGDSYKVDFEVRINPYAENAPTSYGNQATAGGTSGTLTVSDLTDSGTNPDDSNTASNDDTGGHDDATSFIPPVPKPEILATKFAGAPVLNSDLTFNVPFTIIVKNTGDVNMTNLHLQDNLSLNAQLGSTFLGIEGTPVSGISNNISGSAIAPTINSGFTGTSSDPELLIGTDGFLAPEDEYTINFVARIDPNAIGAPTELKNQASTSAVSPDSLSYSDLSDAGDSTGNSNGAPGDTGDEDDPTLLLSTMFTVPAADLLISKVASKKTAAAGDLIPYTILIKNKSNFLAQGISVLDNLPNGFKIDKDTIKVATFDAGHKLLSTATANSSGIDPVTVSNLVIPVETDGYVKITYIVRIGTNILAGDQCNTIKASVNANSNIATACVTIDQNTVLDQSTVIGKVFHDRDGDGYQDLANASGLTLKSDYFGWNSLHLGDLNGRVSVLDNPNDLSKYQKIIRMPYSKKNDFKVTTQQGTVINVDNRGQVTTAHKGLKKKGLTAQDIRVTIRKTRGIPTQTPVKIHRVPLKEMDVLEITITNHGIYEEGIPGVRLATVGGLLIETDGYGRYHIPDVDGGRRSWGKNIIIKVDTATLPTGSRFTTENPRVLRLTSTALNKINFGIKLPVKQQTKPAKKNIKKKIAEKTAPKVGGASNKIIRVELGANFFEPNSHVIKSAQMSNIKLLANNIKKHGRAEIDVIAEDVAKQIVYKRVQSVRQALYKLLGAETMKSVKINIK
ncbi:DUF7507 domain-containing protein [Cocleimonas sp. KMM 6896]|uniref:beta strand repeat-containing protein n=1 Tax=Cocleimonas sp. KMM 6896 TaxID=2993580 RepID=UPI003FA394BB